MTTSPNQIKRLALRVDRDRRLIEASALRKLTAVSGKALRHAGHAVRVGADPSQAARDAIMGNARLGLPGMVPTLTRAMVVADLYGRRRTHLDASRRSLDLSAAEEEQTRRRKRDEELLALLLLLGISGAELESLYASYRPQAINAAERITQTATRAITSSATAPSRYTSRHPRGRTPTRTPFQRTPAGSEPPATIIRRISEGFESGGLTIDNRYGLEREVGKAVVSSYENGRGIGTPASIDALWGFRYSAILDSKTTEICRALDGTIAPKDDAFWLRFTPANHFGCRSLRISVYQSNVLREPTIVQPHATAEQIARFLDIKRQFLSYQ